MRKSTLVFFVILVVGAVGIFGWKWAGPKVAEWRRERTSDAKISWTVRTGGDNYIGYWPMVSPEMKKQAAMQGFRVDFTDDGGDYKTRLKEFNDGKYDLIVLPVNSYLEHGAPYKFPGVIVAAVAESRGADGIACSADKVPSGKVADLNNAGLKFVYTPVSPSEFLLNLTIADFDLFNLRSRNDWRVEAAGSSDVYAKARKKEGDCFVLWEPDLSKALQLSNMKYVWGSDKFAGYIVDVFVFRRAFLEKNREKVESFFKTYFRVLDIYAMNREKLLDEMKDSTGLKHDAIETMLKKVDWFDLQENALLQFGIERKPGDRVNDGVVNTILACTNIMRRVGTFSNDPLQGNPYLITNKSILEDLLKSSVTAVAPVANAVSTDFAPMGEEEWRRLKEVATMRVEPITFQSWGNLLMPEGKEQVDQVAQLLVNNYPSYRVIVRGHTSPGDETANRKLSQERAQTVLQYLTAVHGIDPDRVRAEGAGSQQPPKQKPNESMREYRYRLDRVEFILVEGSSL